MPAEQFKITSGVFAAKSAWLVAAVIAYNLARAAGLLTAGPFGKARTEAGDFRDRAGREL